MLTNKTQNLKTKNLETKESSERQVQISKNVNLNHTEIMNIIEAVKKNNTEEFFRVLSLKVDSFGKKIVDEVDAEYNGSPLYWAANFGHIHFINALLQAGADINKQDKYGRTPVFAAAYNGHAAAITVLSVVRAAMDTRLLDGRTPIWVAAEQGYATAITALSTAGAAMDTPDEHARTPVYIAAENGHVAAITALKAAGAAMDTPDKNRRTPVYIATHNGHAAAITALLEAGSDASVKTIWGDTALERAKEGKEPGHKEIVRLLEAHFKQYPNGIKPEEIVFHATLPSSSEQQNSSIIPPILAQPSLLRRQGYQSEPFNQSVKPLASTSTYEYNERPAELQAMHTLSEPISLEQKDPQILVKKTIYSIPDSRLPINYENWVVSIMRKRHGKNPEHAFLVIEGIDQFGKGILMRYDLVDDNKKSGYALIIDKNLHNIELKQLNLIFRRDLMKQESFYHLSWSISYTQAQSLIEDINRDKEKNITYCISGSASIFADSTNTNSHSCFTWAREKLHNLEDTRIELPEIWTDKICAKTSFYINDREKSLFQFTDYARHISRYPIDNPIKTLAIVTAVVAGGAYYYKNSGRPIDKTFIK